MKSKDSNSKKSVSYQKNDGRGHARPSFFWYDNDKDLKVCFLVTRVNFGVFPGLLLGNNREYQEQLEQMLKSVNLTNGCGVMVT